MNGVLIAGIGNVFLADDGFGVEVLQRMAGRPLPAGVSAHEYGIRGVHLAYDLLDGAVHTLILVDALATGEAPGTLILLDVDDAARAEIGTREVSVDAHAMNPEAVLAALHALGGSVARVRVVGCEPATVAPGIGLSEPVAAAVDAAIDLAIATAAAAAALLPASVETS